jgi:isopenicillin N synthase-like dioxygenase
MEKVPVVDFADDRTVQISTLDAGLREFGFFYVKNHNLDDAVRAQFVMAEALFDLPRGEKEAMPLDSQLDIGYVGPHGQNLDHVGEDDNNKGRSSGVTDTKEQFMQTNNCLITAGADPADAPIIDPFDIFAGSKNYTPNIPDYSTVTGQYASKAYQLNQRLNELLFDALQLDSVTRTQLAHQPFVVLKQMKYAGEPSNPAAGKFGAGAHTDWGSFTILATDQTPGLQIYHNDQWLPVPPRPDCLIINSGDQIAQLTNDTYKSALHRVVTTSTSKPRYSTAVFTYFNVYARVGPLPQFVHKQAVPKYPSRTTLEYFHFKLHQSFGVLPTSITS